MTYGRIQARCHALYYISLRADRAFGRALERARIARYAWLKNTDDPTCLRRYARKVALDTARFRTAMVLFDKPGHNPDCLVGR